MKRGFLHCSDPLPYIRAHLSRLAYALLFDHQTRVVRCVHSVTFLVQMSSEGLVREVGVCRRLLDGVDLIRDILEEIDES